MKKTPRVDRYDPIIYPRKLWVTGCISKTLVNIKREYDTRRESDDVEA